jgi:hypothetical protein
MFSLIEDGIFVIPSTWHVIAWTSHAGHTVGCDHVSAGSRVRCSRKRWFSVVANRIAVV